MEEHSLEAKWLELMKEVDYVQKKGRNAHFGYNYAREEDILAAVRQKLIDLQLVIFTSIKNVIRNGELTEIFSEHTIVDIPTSRERKIDWYGQGQDKGDKGSGKAETNDGKYFLLKNLLIPTGDDPESDVPAGRKRPRAAAPPKEAPAPAANGAPARLPTRLPSAATPHQLGQIQKLAQELGLDLQRDIAAKMQIAWPPDKDTADRILKRLNEKKLEGAKKA